MKFLISKYIVFEESYIANWVTQIIQGLAQLHSMEVPHGNLRSANIFVKSDGSLKIADFSKIHTGLDKNFF